MSRPESAIIIVNSSASALEILGDIGKFARFFASRPIRLLRCDCPDHVGVIRALQAKYKIASVPALVAKDGSVIIGKARIREFIPKLARLVSKIADAEREQAQQQRLPITRRLARYSAKDDDEDSDDERDPQKSKDSIDKKIARYRAAMAARGARIGEKDDAPRAPPTGAHAQRAQGDQIEDDEPPHHGVAPPRGPPPQGGKGAPIPDSMFDEAMLRGIQEDLDADTVGGRAFDAERAVRDLVLKG
jgi:hypothetical protein